MRDITLLDVFRAIEPGPLFALHRSTPDPDCIVGSGIGTAMTAVYARVEDVLHQELGKTTLEDVLEDVLRAE